MCVFKKLINRDRNDTVYLEYHNNETRPHRHKVMSTFLLTDEDCGAVMGNGTFLFPK